MPISTTFATVPRLERKNLLTPSKSVNPTRCKLDQDTIDIQTLRQAHATATIFRQKPAPDPNRLHYRARNRQRIQSAPTHTRWNVRRQTEPLSWQLQGTLRIR